jgi:glutamate racemase
MSAPEAIDRAMSRPIGIFDSGLGGLSVVEPIRSLLPYESLIYVADSKHCPYGDKPEQFLRDRAIAIGDFLVGQGCKAIVVACNTASAASVGMMRERFKLPVVAVEPAVKPAAALTRSGVIGVLATRTTLHSEQYALLLARYAATLEVVGEVCPGWVEAVERGELDTTETAAMVAQRVHSLIARGVDTLVLGCTHFPFLREQVERAAGPEVTILDTGGAVARQLQRRLGEKGLLGGRADSVQHRFLTSNRTDELEAFVRRVWPDIGPIEPFTH